MPIVNTAQVYLHKNLECLFYLLWEFLSHLEM